jgi:hypothetical protein
MAQLYSFLMTMSLHFGQGEDDSHPDSGMGQKSGRSNDAAGANRSRMVASSWDLSRPEASEKWRPVLPACATCAAAAAVNCSLDA